MRIGGLLNPGEMFLFDIFEIQIGIRVGLLKDPLVWADEIVVNLISVRCDVITGPVAQARQQAVLACAAGSRFAAAAEAWRNRIH